MAFENPASGFLEQDGMANNQAPYILVNQQNYQSPPPPGASPSSYRSLPFDQAAGGTAPSGGLPQTSFRAPAHKHAHHLHSIPPREKSTRTLIVDHMLWVHGRTRFAQARAELGMTDRTGGSSSPNYMHRTRPEGYEEEEEEGSEGEDVPVLKARAGGPGHPHDEDEDERRRRQDLALARTLRLRAEGIEKVITSMLDQPPPVHPLNDEDVVTPPTSPKLNATSVQDPHRLPNGVRLRLALGTIINDLFARQAPRPPYRHTNPVFVGKAATPTPSDHSSLVPTPSDLPEALNGLATISGAFAPVPRQIPSVPALPPPPPPPAYSDYPGSSSSQYAQPGSSSAQAAYPSFPPSSSAAALPPLVERHARPRPSPRTKELYSMGSDPSTANSPPAFRCPRHLHTGCEICVEAKSPQRPTQGSGSHHHHHHQHHRGRSGSSSSFAADRSSFSASSLSSSWRGGGGVGPPPQGGGITGWQDGSGIGSGLLKPGVRGNALRRKVVENEATAGAGNTKLSKLIARFIRLSALVAAELGREARGEEQDDGGEGDGDGEDERERERERERVREQEGTGVGPGDNRSQERSEDGRAAGGDREGSAGGGSAAGTPTANVSTPGKSPWSAGFSPLPASPTMARQTHGHSHSHSHHTHSQSQSQAHSHSQTHHHHAHHHHQRPRRTSASSSARERSRAYAYALRPSREWYMLLAGLLTRAVLEGYLTAGWNGLQAVQCLLQVGLGVNEDAGRRRHGHGHGHGGHGYGHGRGYDFREDGDGDDGEEEFEAFDPDELPDLVQAVRILFPSLREGAGGRGLKDEAEDEYEVEMLERLRRFYDIPASTPDCSTHMEDLAWQYPAEPVERAAVRFCEAIGKWRGKPELETYKKKPPPPVEPTSPGGTSPMTIESLVHSNPTSPVTAHGRAGSGRRRSMKKPSIDLYFPSMKGAAGQQGQGGRQESPGVGLQRQLQQVQQQHHHQQQQSVAQQLYQQQQPQPQRQSSQFQLPPPQPLQHQLPQQTQPQSQPQPQPQYQQQMSPPQLQLQHQHSHLHQQHSHPQHPQHQQQQQHQHQQHQHQNQQHQRTTSGSWTPTDHAGAGSGGGGSKRYRDADDVGRLDGNKRMYSS